MAEKTVSLWTPIIYVSVLFTALVIFSKVHRQRKLQKLANTVQFYEYNFAKDAYLELKSTPKVPTKLMKSALLAWATENFTRLLRYRENEPNMVALLQKGDIGEEAFERFTGSKTLNETELQELAGEAKLLDPKWDTMIQSVTEIAQQNAVRRRLAQIGNLKQEYYELAGPASNESIETKKE